MGDHYLSTDEGAQAPSYLETAPVELPDAPTPEPTAEEAPDVKAPDDAPQNEIIGFGLAALSNDGVYMTHSIYPTFAEAQAHAVEGDVIALLTRAQPSFE